MNGDVQMSLFADLPVPPDAAEQFARRSCLCVPWRLAVSVLRQFGKRRPRPRPQPEQLPLRMVLRQLERDTDDDFDFPRHQVLAANDAPAPSTVAPVSIFALAQEFKGMKARGRFGDAAGFAAAPYRVERDGDRVRVVRLRQDETEEWREKERVRRAKQRPPKPTRKAKTRSKKLLEMIGDPDD